MAPTKPPSRRPSQTQAPRPPISRDLELEELADSCTRFLSGDGPRTVATLLGTIPDDAEVDYYGVGGAVSALESDVARLLGKESALFVPTGTMAQQAVLRVHADRRLSRSIAFHPTCHLDGWAEERGYQGLHGLFGIPVGPREQPLTLRALEGLRQPVAALLIELPQRALGGTLPTWGDLTKQVQWARDRGAAVHLDGARLWEASAFYSSAHRKSLVDVAGLFDTVYVSFYKGLGGLGGCCVAGDRDVIDELSVWRTRHGGRVFMMWPYAASARTVIAARLPKMPAYFRHAKAIGRALRGVQGVEVLPDPPQSPMLHVRLAVTLDDMIDNAKAIARSDGVWTFARPFVSEGPALQRCELSVGDATLELSADEIAGLFGRLAS
ncbi:MAG TPA: beta-eliminating lyase-related protein [Acidimicrobiales bacterium]|jgi:threonine aldolase|nr:beta-eliminating lyase-related protein [Acidimicrobiales bacterium]